MRALLGVAFYEAPGRLYGYAVDKPWGKFVLLAVVLAVLAIGGGTGAGIAWLRGDDVSSGMGSGIGVAGVLLLLYTFLVLSLVVGIGLASLFGRDRTTGTGRHTEAGADGRRPVAPWVVAAFFGLLGGVVGVATAAAALGEQPYRGPRAETDATVLSWTPGTFGRHGRIFTVMYTVDGTRTTGTIAIEDDPALTIDSARGDRTRVEYQLDDPTRVRGAGVAAEKQDAAADGAWFAAGCLAVAAVVAAWARLRRPRATEQPPFRAASSTRMRPPDLLSRRSAGSPWARSWKPPGRGS